MRELAVRRAGKTVRRMAPPGQELIEHRSNPHVVRAEVTRLERRGEVKRIGPIVHDAFGVYVLVVRLKPPPPRWHRYALVGGASLAAVGAVCAAIWLVLWMVGIVLGMLPYLLGGVLAVAVILRICGGGGGHGHSGGMGFHWTPC